MGFCVLFHVLLCVAFVSSSIAIILMGEERAGCFTLFVFLMSCDCSVALHPGAACWSAVCDCGIFQTLFLFSSLSDELPVYGSPDLTWLIRKRGAVDMVVIIITINMTRKCHKHVFPGVNITFTDSFHTLNTTF